jgi:hypothetical protein
VRATVRAHRRERLARSRTERRVCSHLIRAGQGEEEPAKLGDEHGRRNVLVALPFVVSYDGSAPSGVVTIGDFAARRIDLD